ncbi:hypothetical protein J1605_004282 [Eschrichtius robustus]|uniref:SUI1 domain-containing protein n=1 Tax=Eschrichtius robustus TaxID=9764 RepID=A0AB34HF41_ESCRO|nr:hypothetical protein J1605_004282 [Eschrichtius robustus]
MQGTRVQALIREDPTCHGATKPVRHNYWACALEPAVSTEEKELYHMSAIQNLHSFDPFADASKGDDLLLAGTEDYIDKRIQRRNGWKTLTTVQGIADDYGKKKLVKAFKKIFA